jgi:hypothetical protein
MARSRSAPLHRSAPGTRLAVLFVEQREHARRSRLRLPLGRQRGGGHHDGWWLPGAILGGLAVGAVAVVTAPFVALSAVAAAPPAAYAPPPVTYAPPVVYAPPPAYAAPAPAYQQAPSYAPQVAAVQREVVYPNGRYVLYGDGVRQPWQWVWVPSASPPPPPPPPQQ